MEMFIDAEIYRLLYGKRIWNIYAKTSYFYQNWIENQAVAERFLQL